MESGDTDTSTKLLDVLPIIKHSWETEMYYGKGYGIMPVFRGQLSLQFKKPHKKQYGDSSTKINLKNIFFCMLLWSTTYYIIEYESQ